MRSRWLRSAVKRFSTWDFRLTGGAEKILKMGLELGRIETEEMNGLLDIKSFHPLHFENVVPFLLDFPTIWLVDTGFSATNYLTTKNIIYCRWKILIPEAEPS